jgi:hypothetical protein
MYLSGDRRGKDDSWVKDPEKPKVIEMGHKNSFPEYFV